MITGDHLLTARAIASELGMLSHDDTIVTGHELTRLSDKALVDRIGHTRVYARVDPAQRSGL